MCKSDEIIHKEIYPVVPLKTEYSMTEFGETLRPIIMAMCDWGRTYKRNMIK